MATPGPTLATRHNVQTIIGSHLRPNRPSGGSHGLPVYGTSGAMLVGSSPAQVLTDSLPLDTSVVSESMGGFDTESLANPTAEIARLRESLARAEERRRLEAVLFEERARRVEAELEQCRAEGVLFSRLCEERDSLVGTLRAELMEAQGQRDAYQAELAEARFELERRFAAALENAVTAAERAESQARFELERRFAATGTTLASIPGRLGTSPPLRQSSGPPPSSLPERNISDASKPTRLGSGPDRLSDSRGPWPQVATAASVALAAAVAQAAQATTEVAQAETSSISRGAASARGAAPTRVVGSGPIRQRSGEPVVSGQTALSTASSHGTGGFQPKHLGPRPSSLPPPGHGTGESGGGRSVSRTTGISVAGIPEGVRDDEQREQQPQSGYNTGSAVVRTPSKSGNKGRRSPEKPVEICISVPRALTPDELREMAEIQEQPQLTAVPPARSLRSLPQTSQSASMQPVHQASAPYVNRQASAPYGPTVAPASPTSSDQWQSDARWTGPGAAPPPPVRIVAAQQQQQQQQQQQSGPHKVGSGSATVPTATTVTDTTAPPRAVVATASNSPPSATGTVRPTISQARLGVAMRR